MNTPINGQARGARANISPTIAIVSFAYAASALLLLHILRPDYTPIDHMISDYAVGRYGGIMTTVFLAMSIGCLALMLGLLSYGPRSIFARLGASLLAVAAVGLVVTAMFPTDLEGAPATSSGDIHTISFLVNIGSVFLATVLLAVSFGGDYRWSTYRNTAAILTLTVAAAFVFQFLTLHPGMPYGIANRCFVAVLFVWLLTTSARVRAVARLITDG
jgi:hypothetical protein